MKIVAKSVKGHEFMYNPTSAHEVSNNSAEYICKVLNNYRFNLKGDETWFIHDVDKYDRAYDYAMYQRFTVRNGVVKQHVA